MRTYGSLQQGFEKALRNKTGVAGPSPRRLPNPNWLDDLAEPFARWLLEHARQAGYDRYEALGPCGIGARLSVTLMPIATRGRPADDWRNPDNLHVTVEPSGSPIRLALIDYETDTRRFAPNSLGAINGLNHPATDIRDDATAGSILAPMLAKLAAARATPSGEEQRHPVQTEMFAPGD